MCVGHVEVIQGSGVGVVAEGGDGVSVAEPSLRLEDLALADQLRADTVAKAVKGSVGEAGGEAEPFEAMGEQIGPGVTEPSEVRGEDPVGDDLGRTDPLPPRLECSTIIAAVVAPSVTRRFRLVLVVPSTSSDNPRSMSTPGRRDRPGGARPVHPGGRRCRRRAGSGGGSVRPRTTPADRPFSGAAARFLVAISTRPAATASRRATSDGKEVFAGDGPRRRTHPLEWVTPQIPLGHGPRQRRVKDRPSTPDHRHRRPRRPPAGHRPLELRGAQPGQAEPGEAIGGQEPSDGPVQRPGGRLPLVVRFEVAGQQFGDRPTRPAKYNALLSTPKRSTRSLRYASALSASPCIVKERWILRPV